MDLYSQENDTQKQQQDTTKKGHMNIYLWGTTLPWACRALIVRQ